MRDCRVWSAGLVVLTMLLCSASGPAPTEPKPLVTGVRVAGRTLLTHPGSSGDQAHLGGPLGTNAAGCITVNGLVVVWPGGTELLGDGSVVVAGRTLALGSRVDLAGGFWPEPVPASLRCGTDRYWDGGPAQ